MLNQYDGALDSTRKNLSIWSKMVVENTAMMVSTMPKWHSSLSGCLEAAAKFVRVTHQHSMRNGNWPMGVLIN
jgi:hypothetical protein